MCAPSPIFLCQTFSSTNYLRLFSSQRDLVCKPFLTTQRIFSDTFRRYFKKIYLLNEGLSSSVQFLLLVMFEVSIFRAEHPSVVKHKIFMTFTDKPFVLRHRHHHEPQPSTILCHQQSFLDTTSQTWFRLSTIPRTAKCSRHNQIWCQF